ncbi:unnamed protein product [Closterium sp. Yama58-4]|nr:unnamed protein product [Closterium sp. Yama58-4]
MPVIEPPIDLASIRGGGRGPAAVPNLPRGRRRRPHCSLQVQRLCTIRPPFVSGPMAGHQGGFAFCHCSTCKTRFHLRVCPPPDPRFRHLKFRFFVARDVVLVTLLVQLLIICLGCIVNIADVCFFDMAILKAWGEDAPTVFYVYGLLLFLILAGLFGAVMTCVDRRFRSDLAAPCRDLGECCHRSNFVCGCHCHSAGPCCCSCTSCCHPGMCTGQGVFVFLVTTGAILLVVLALVGVFYCLLVSILVVQRICQQHYHVLAKRILTKEYIVEDLAGMSLPPDWSPPPLLPEHERQLRDLRLLFGDEEESKVEEEQPQCRICLENDGHDLIAPCKCKGSARFVHRSCLDQWRATKEGFAFCHCSTCKTRFHLRVCPPPDPRFRHLKFRFFVARDIVFVTLLVQLVSCLFLRYSLPRLLSRLKSLC